jgi:hypothetical protein
MKKIIEIDKNTQIQIIKGNFLLLHKKKSKTGRIAWQIDGRFPTLTSLCLEYLNNSPYRAIHATEDFKRLIEIIREAENNIRDLIINNTHPCK